MAVAEDADRETSYVSKLVLACSFGILGAATRYGLQEIAGESSVPSLPSLMPLVVGCFVMAMVEKLSSAM